MVTEPFGEVKLRHHYELHLSAAEEDPLRPRKDSLLTSCAMDGPLFLTADALCEVCHVHLMTPVTLTIVLSCFPAVKTIVTFSPNVSRIGHWQ